MGPGLVPWCFNPAEVLVEGKLFTAVLGSRGRGRARHVLARYETRVPGFRTVLDSLFRGKVFIYKKTWEGGEGGRGGGAALRLLMCPRHETEQCTFGRQLVHRRARMTSQTFGIVSWKLPRRTRQKYRLPTAAALGTALDRAGLGACGSRPDADMAETRRSTPRLLYILFHG